MTINIDRKERAAVAERKLELIADDLEFVILASLESQLVKDMTDRGFDDEQIELAVEEMYNTMDVYLSLKEGVFTIACNHSGLRQTICKKLDIRRVFSFSVGIVRAIFGLDNSVPQDK